jgi:hypothetical protein
VFQPGKMTDRGSGHIVRTEEAVSKLAWSGLSALDSLFRLPPGALPQADIDRAFGPSTLWSGNNSSAKGAMPYQPGAKPQD